MEPIVVATASDQRATIDPIDDVEECQMQQLDRRVSGLIVRFRSHSGINTSDSERGCSKAICCGDI